MKKILIIILCLSMSINSMAAISLIDFDGFESGGTEGVSHHACTVAASPTPWSSKETYVLFIPNFDGLEPASNGYFQSKYAYVNNTDWISMAFWGQWNHMDRTVNLIYTFFKANYGNPHFTLECVTTTTKTAKIRLKDTWGDIVGTTTNDVMFADQWFLIEIKWNRSTTGDIIIWLNGVIIFNETGVELNSATSAVNLSLANTSSVITPTDLFVDSYYFQTDNGANMNTNRTLYGRYTVLGAWKTRQTGTAPDFGDTLDGGAWTDSENVPQNTSTKIHYSTSFGGGSESGGISKDRAGTGGVKNDSDRDNTIRGGKWIWVWKAELAGWFGGVPRWWGKYGANTTPTADNTLNTPVLSGNSNWKNYSIVSNAMFGTGRVPQVNDYAQIGFGVSAAENPGAAYVSDMWVFILHEEKRAVLTDGHIIKKVN